MEAPASQAQGTPVAAPTKQSVQHLRYLGTGGSLFILGLKHALLTVITLGVYSFWARSNMRAYHYSHSELGGEPFSWHGTGAELFKGTLKAGLIIFAVVFVIVLVPSLLLAGMTETTQVLVSLAIYPVFGVLSLLAVNAARRYRLSRSSWRGVRFSFQGHFGAFVGMMLKGILLTTITLGFYSPVFATKRRAFMVNHARFGSEPFIYEGTARPLYGEFIKAVLLSIPTLGLYWIWYGAFVQRYMWSHTRIAGARFVSTVTGGGLLSLHFTNMLLVMFTLGIATPWALVRMHQYQADNLMLRGAPDWATIQQRVQQADATGEGLAEGMDIDVGIGI